MISEKIVGGFAKAGPWALMSLLLVSVIIFEVRPTLAAIRAEHAEMRLEMNKALTDLVEYAKRSAYLEFRNCVNTATTNELRERCVPPEELR